MDIILYPPSDEFAEHDSVITSLRKNNFQRLAGELHLHVATAVILLTVYYMVSCMYNMWPLA